MECPLCEHTGLDADVKTCPSCKADLTAYQTLDAIEASAKKQKMTTLLFIILFIIALLACVAIFFLAGSEGTSKEDEQKLIACETLSKDLKAENQQLKENIAGLQAKNTKLLEVEEPDKPASKDIMHVVKEGETLFMIARDYLGDGNLYSKIANDNGIEDPNLIYVGKEIIINK